MLNKWHKYEEYKKALQRQNLSNAEYLSRLKFYIKKIKL